MTYDWNKMVDITVPTGTNGWIYSGEVTINGVKVRFPVGTPTSVPEPAAALLNKMIELEREDADNTAKPNNHYVGNVTIPAGKTLTLAKGAKVVDEDGVLGAAPSDIVILPETELMTANVEEGSNGQYVLTTPLENTPTVGVTYKMFWGGVEYTSKAVEVLIEAAGAAGIALGNTDYLGLDNVENPGAGMPILVVLFPDGVVEDPGDPVMYCMAVSMGITPDPPVLSIVQTEGGSADSGNGSSGALVVTAVISGDTIGAVTVDSVSATHADMYAAVMSGRDVLCIATHPKVTDTSETVTTLLRPVQATEEFIVLSCKTAMNSGMEIILRVSASNQYAALIQS